nr:alpha-amidating enzyme precursor 1 [Biomphalaria glabrata]
MDKSIFPFAYRTHAHGLENLYQDTKTQDILMPGAKPNTPDTYLCTTYPVLEEELYIYKFEALANAATAHHMLLYGCDGEPFSTDSICNYQYISDSEPADNSGLKLYTTHQKPQYVAGIFLLHSGDFTILLHTNLYPVDISCTFMIDKSIIPFAFRTHAHGLGTVITGYQYNGTYHEICKGNPQWPQAFYPVKEVIEIKPGDALAVRCTYNSSLMDHPVGVGSTGNDEMCNYYIMLYTDSSVADPSGECAFNELTQLTGKNFPIDVSVTLPPNPALEEAAIGSHNHAGMNHPGEANVDFEDTQILKILMLGASPRKPDSYLCTAYPAQDLESYIYKFEAVADANRAHHMLLYGCEGEAYSQNCPAMCKNSHPVILFARAKNAPPTILPKAFPVDVCCRFSKEKSIFPFAYKPHAHGLVTMKHVQEYYDEYAANDMREKGMYGTATSSEEGLSRNRNKGFEAISQQLEHFPRKNASGRINQSQRLDQNQGKQPLSENTNHASINRQNSEPRKHPNSVVAIEVGQSEAVHKPHSCE